LISVLFFKYQLYPSIVVIFTVIKDDTYYLPIKFLPASFVGTVNISLAFALHKKVNVVAEIKPENDGILYVKIPMANWATKLLGKWQTTEDKFWQPHIKEVVINIEKVQ
jgi:hypothetical protein